MGGWELGAVYAVAFLCGVECRSFELWGELLSIAGEINQFSSRFGSGQRHAIEHESLFYELFMG